MSKRQAKKPLPGRRIDWPAVQRDYRTSKFTQAELATKHHVDQATLSRKIKKDRTLDPAAWPQDLSEAVRQATNARVLAETVKSEIISGQESVKDTVKAAAEVNAQVIFTHQRRLTALVRDAETARDKLLALADQVADVKEAAILVSAIESLSRTTKTLIDKERQVYGIDDESKGGVTGFEDLVSDLA